MVATLSCAALLNFPAGQGTGMPGYIPSRFAESICNVFCIAKRVLACQNSYA